MAHELKWLVSLLYFLLQYGAGLFPSLGHDLCNRDDGLALLQFRQTLNINWSRVPRPCVYSDHIIFPYPKMLSWNRSSTDCCKWDGVTCHKITGRVIGLNLRCGSLEGIIRPNSSLFRLSGLQKLDLSSNNFFPSQISGRIGELTSLTHLSLSYSGFRGNVPSELSYLSKLVLLDISARKAIWDPRIGYEQRDFQMLLQNLTQIRQLSLANLAISSTLPANWSSSLRYLDLSGTGVYGKLSDSVFHLPKLQNLILAGNQNLTFSFSKSNCSISPLQVLVLSGTAFSGEFSDIGCFQSLTALHLEECGISGFIPESIGNLSQLVNLNVAVNNLTGQIPVTISNLENLMLLSLGSNHFTGQLPHSIFNLTKLQILYLGNISFSGTLPSNVSGLQKLSNLNLENNAFEGTLPSWLFSLQSLEGLILSHNHFSGPFPEFEGTPTLRLIDLSSNQLQGSIPESIGNLSQLINLNVDTNNLTGQIPVTISNLENLMLLSLDSNHFTGQLPHSIFNLTKLQFLTLTNTSISGTLPSNVSGLPKLINLNLRNNALEGKLPSWLFSLPSLQGLILSHNNFSGQFPEFKGTPTLSLIDLSSNQLQGSIPKSISTLLNLRILLLSSNNLSGIVDSYLFSDLHELGMLEISGNRLSWSNELDVDISFPKLAFLGMSSNEIKEFPSFLKNSHLITVLDFSNNKLHGLIPSWLTSIPLQHLSLSHNCLTGLQNPDQHDVNLRSFKTLDLGFNKFQGPLPSFFCTFEELEFLDFSNNNFSGAIPECFGKFSSKLLQLNLEKNNLQGAISMAFTKDSCSLRNLGLNGNLLEGSLPKSLANCRDLSVLHVGNNRINDTFPKWLENLKELEVLILRANKFSGPIDTSKAELGFPKLRILDLSNNEFTGVLSARLFRSFKAMINLDMSRTLKKYMGTRFNISSDGLEFWPDYYDAASLVTKGRQLDFLRITKFLVVIDLSRNKFMGGIPKDIANLKSLVALNLSHNQISGHIPSQLGELSSLESLDLSWNQIEGMIPQQLTNLISLEFLNLSQNYLVGLIPQGKQFNTFLNDSYGGNLGLCGPPLTNNCEGPHLQSTPLQGSHEREDDLSFMGGFTWKSVLIGYGCGIVLGLAIGNLMFFTRKPTWLVRIIEQEVYDWYTLLFRKNKTYKKSKRSKRRAT